MDSNEVKQRQRRPPMDENGHRVPIKEHLEKLCGVRMDELEKLFGVKLADLKEFYDARSVALEKAVSVAYVQMDRRLDTMNEFREQLKDQSASFITKSEYFVKIDVLDKDVRELRESRAELKGKASQTSVNIGYVVSALGVILGILSFVLNLTK